MTNRAALLVVLACVAGAGCATESLDSPGAQGTVSVQPDSTTEAADSALQALSDACEAGSGEACDQLWSAAFVGSDFEEIGASCGDRITPIEEGVFGNCAEVLPGMLTTEPTVATAAGAPPTTTEDPTPPTSPTVAVSPTTTIDGGPGTLSPATIPERPADLVTPSEGNWIVIVASLEVGGDNNVARAAAAAAALRDRVRVGSEFFLSNDAASLNPGFWIVYSGQFETSDEARTSCAALLAEKIVNDCYARLVEGVSID